MRKIFLLFFLLCSCYKDSHPKKYILTTTVIPKEGGSVEPKREIIDVGQQISITAIPASNYKFDGWQGDLTGVDNPINFIINSDKNVIALFKLDPFVYYPFNGDAKDYSGNDIHAETYNTDLTEDRFGNKNFAYKFNGVNSVIQVNNPEKFILSNESFTVSIWVKILDNENTYRTFFIMSNLDVIPRFELMKARSNIENGGIFAELYNINNERSVVWSKLNGEDLPKNEWIHLAVVANYDSSQFSLYINSELQDSVNLIDYSSPIEDNIMVRFGETTFSNNIFNRQRHNGSLDDFRFFKKALSANEIKQLFNEKFIYTKP